MEPLKFPLKIGDLAAATGLTERALRHYDEIGLLSPSQRTESNYRLYTEADVERLQRITSLKNLGFSLEQIAECLKRPEFSVLNIAEMHLAKLQEMQAAQQELMERLDSVLRFARHTGKTSAKDLLDAIALMQKAQSYYSEEELADMRERGKKLGRAAIVAAEEEWPKLIAVMTEHMEKGTDPADPAVRSLARRWQELVDAFTGGNAQIAAKLKKMYEENPHAAEQFGGPSPRLREYVDRALAILNQ